MGLNSNFIQHTPRKIYRSQKWSKALRISAVVATEPKAVSFPAAKQQQQQRKWTGRGEAIAAWAGVKGQPIASLPSVIILLQWRNHPRITR